MTKNNKTSGLVCVFEYLDDVCSVMDKLDSREDCKGYEVYSPTSYHELMDRAEKKLGKSQVRWFTLCGALLGVVSGFGMCLAMDYDWPIVVGGKAPGLYSLPAYVIFGFELMILFGALATIKGMLVMGRLPNPRAKIFDLRLTDDHFAVFIPGADCHGEQASVMKDCGAKEIYEST